MKKLSSLQKKLFSTDPLILYPAIFNISSILAITLLIFLTSSKLPKQLPLFYSLPWGENQLASINQFLILPATVLLITLVNLIISWHIHSSQKVLKRMLSLGASLIALLVLITVLKIIFIFI